MMVVIVGETGGQILQGLPNFIELKKNRSRERSASKHINIREAYWFWLCKFLILLILLKFGLSLASSNGYIKWPSGSMFPKIKKKSHSLTGFYFMYFYNVGDRLCHDKTYWLNRIYPISCYLSMLI